jgi:hypothetical protein
MKEIIIDLATLDGFAKAEQVQTELYEQYDNVDVKTLGETKVIITAY